MEGDKTSHSIVNAAYILTEVWSQGNEWRCRESYTDVEEREVEIMEGKGK